MKPVAPTLPRVKPGAAVLWRGRRIDLCLYDSLAADLRIQSRKWGLFYGRSVSRQTNGTCKQLHGTQAVTIL
jgi:hypothetical protein